MSLLLRFKGIQSGHCSMPIFQRKRNIQNSEVIDMVSLIEYLGSLRKKRTLS